MTYLQYTNIERKREREREQISRNPRPELRMFWADFLQ